MNHGYFYEVVNRITQKHENGCYYTIVECQPLTNLARLILSNHSSMYMKLSAFTPIVKILHDKDFSLGLPTFMRQTVPLELNASALYCSGEPVLQRWVLLYLVKALCLWDELDIISHGKVV